MAKILVCPPTFFGVHYTINPWMKLDNQVNQNLALHQWKRLIRIIRFLGHEVLELSPDKTFPDMVFTADAGLVLGQNVMLSNFKHPQRQGEKQLFKKWFEEHDYHIHELSSGVHFEGAGDALFAGHKLFLGYGFRSDQNIWTEIAQIMPELKNFIFCHLIDEFFYHLNTCFCPINQNQALIYHNALHHESLLSIARYVEFIDVPKEEAFRMACNTVILDNTAIVPAGCPETKDKLHKMGYNVFGCNMSEFLKAGGACKCLTLKI